MDTSLSDNYTLSLHDALPICSSRSGPHLGVDPDPAAPELSSGRSEEHTSELQSRGHLVCRLLLEKKNIKKNITLNKITYLLLNIVDACVLVLLLCLYDFVTHS